MHTLPKTISQLGSPHPKEEGGIHHRLSEHIRSANSSNQLSVMGPHQLWIAKGPFLVFNAENISWYLISYSLVTTKIFQWFTVLIRQHYNTVMLHVYGTFQKKCCDLVMRLCDWFLKVTSRATVREPVMWRSSQQVCVKGLGTRLVRDCSLV